MSHKIFKRYKMKNCKYMITIFLLTILPLNAAQAQQKIAAEKVDSVLAVMPQMNDGEKDKALKLLIDFTTGSQDEKLYTRRYIDFAHSRKNIEGESWALLRLAQTYYAQRGTDSVFIYGEEAIRFAKQHKLYDNLSDLRNMLISRYHAKGRTLSALRLAEEAYEEAKALDDHYLKSRVQWMRYRYFKWIVTEKKILK